MDPAILIAVLAVLAAVFGPLATLLVAARRFSGKITDSSASDLWSESRSIRQDLADRNKFLADSITRMDERVLSLEKLNNDLRRENNDLRDKIRALEVIIAELRDQIASLLSEKDVLKDRLAQ